MRVDAIHVHNFLSFDSFSWQGLDPHLNVIIGPNGSGKTNLSRAIRAVVDAINYKRYESAGVWSQATHSQSQQQTIMIIVDVVFDGEWEQRLLASFFAASLCNERNMQEAVRSRPNGGVEDPVAFARYASQVARDVRRKDLNWFYCGRLVASFNGIRWQTHYEARPGATNRFFLGLDSLRGSSILLGHKQSNVPSGGSLFQLWLDSLDPMEQTACADSSEQHQRPAPRKDAVLDTLVGRGDRSEMPPHTFSMLPALISSTYGVMLQVERPSTIALDTYRAFEVASGIHLDGNAICDARRVFETLLERTCVFSDNLRRAPRQTFAPRQLGVTNVDLSTGENLALMLFTLKNAATKGQRERYTRIQHLFRALTDRDFQVGILTQTAPSGQRVAEEVIPLMITTDGGWGDVPLEYSGAGIAEALLLSALIEGADGRLVLLDEPASNLYPLAQSALLKELQQRTANQFLVVTHAPALISPDKPEQVSRLYVNNGRTVRTALNLNDMDREQAEKVRKELRRSLDLRALLFSRAVILVEGETELGALPVWFEEEYGYPLERSDITIYCVGGDTIFPIPMFLLHQFAVPFAVICDGRVMGDRQPPRIIEYMRSAGIPELPEVAGGLDFLKLRDILSTTGVFTVAKAAIGTDEKFEALPVIHDHISEAGRIVGSSKARRGRYIAESYPCPGEVKDLFQRIQRYLDTKGIPIDVAQTSR